MNNLQENEARALLTKPLFCEDLGDWMPIRKSLFIHEIESGLIDEDGIATKLHLKLHYFYNPSTKVKNYLFSMYNKTPYGLERVYQLDIFQTSRDIKDLHKRPHEHIGNKRLTLDEAFKNCNFTVALNHFLSQTNITISGDVDSPEEFRLK